MNDNITFVTDWKLLEEGGLAEVQAEIERGGYSLVIIDTVSRALGSADQLDLAKMTVVIGNLQRIAQLNDVAIVVIDHHRKSGGLMSDPIDDIIASTGKAAVADAVLGMYREQGKRQVILKGRGRDMDDIELTLEWDGLTFSWQLLGEAGEVWQMSNQAKILSAINDLMDMGEIPSTTRIASHAGMDKGNVSRELADLIHKNKLVKGEKVSREVPYYPVDHVRGVDET